MLVEKSAHSSELDLLEEVTRRLDQLLKTWPEGKPFRIALTGGTLGIASLRFFAKARLEEFNLEVFWGDERWVPKGHPDRNDAQAFDAWPSLVGANLHQFSSPDELSIEVAAAEMNRQFQAVFGAEPSAGFDLLLLGVGPDGHVASLFPGKDAKQNQWVVFEEDSPKPPKQRLSFSYEALNLSQRVWFLASGEQKANVVSQAINEPTRSNLPCALVTGRLETTWFIDNAIEERLG